MLLPSVQTSLRSWLLLLMVVCIRICSQRCRGHMCGFVIVVVSFLQQYVGSDPEKKLLHLFCWQLPEFLFACLSSAQITLKPKSIGPSAQPKSTVQDLFVSFTSRALLTFLLILRTASIPITQTSILFSKQTVTLQCVISYLTIFIISS